jgi:hypothetical protein
MTLLIARFATCMGHTAHERVHSRHATCMDKPSDLLYVLGLLVEALLFGMFTSCMMFDQVEVINSKMTHIDRLKGTDIGGSLPGIMEVFGLHTRIDPTDTRFRRDWLSPFVRACFPDPLRDEVMGFCRPCRPKPEVEFAADPRSGGLRSVAEIV